MSHNRTGFQQLKIQNFDHAATSANAPITDEILKQTADYFTRTSQFCVFGIPTVLTIRGGKEVGRVTGAQNEAGYRAMVEALSTGGEVKIPLTNFDRMLRLGGGGLFVMVGISTGNWIVAGVGGILAFMGIYDRCPKRGS